MCDTTELQLISNETSKYKQTEDRQPLGNSDLDLEHSTISDPRSWFGLLYKGARVAECESNLYSTSGCEPSVGILHHPSTPKCCSLSLERDLSSKGKEGALLPLPFPKIFKKLI